MNDSFNEQKEILCSLKHEISLLHQQVDYLIRNEKDLGLLDLDVMMNRTHRIYDQLCSINIGHPADEDQDLEIAPEMLNAFFGLDEKNEETEEPEEAKGESEDVIEESEELTEDSEENTIETEEEIAEPVETLSENDALSENEGQPEEAPVEETPKEEDYGFIFKMEPLEEAPETASAEEGSEPDNTSNVYTTGDEIEMVIPHIDFPEIPYDASENPEEEQVSEEQTPEEGQTFETEELAEEEQTPEIEEITEDEQAPEEEELPVDKEESLEEDVESPERELKLFEEDTFTDEQPFVEAPQQHPEDELAYEPIIFGDMEEKEDVGFEIEETLGEKMQHEEDHSLAAKLQHQSVLSLKSSIGINDKFLLVNELFNGSMEKYNRSIENLDDLKTLNGALIYLNELRIELQWNSNNEAYKKLLGLVHRKFEQ